MHVRSMVLLALGLGFLTAQAKTALVLPVQGDLEKAADVGTVNELFREAVQNGYHGEVKAGKDSAHGCAERECAAKMAKDAGADEAVFATVKKLGSKWIFSATVVNAGNSDAFNQRGMATSIEDLEAVTHRVADALVTRKSFESAATTENITAKEEQNEPTRRRSLYVTGFSLGYLYPMAKSYAYLKEGNYDPATGRYPYTLKQPYSQMVRLDWLNYWEFRQNLMLGFEGAWALPNVIGGDIDVQYLFNNSDYTPFMGGGLGIQYVGDLSDSSTTAKRHSGPALNLQGGMILFRTYDVHVMARAQYQVVFDSDVDNGLTFDVGIIYRPSEKRESSGWGSFWGYYLLGALLISVIGAAAH